nr:amino acid adenylation domain-containing protein [Algibacter mikhailovii]
MKPSTLVDIITNAVELFPSKEAFKCEENALSFNELDIKTSQLASCLVDLGVDQGDRVGIYLNRCIETVIAIYGILKAGAAYVPLDFTAPHARTQSIIDNCDISFLVSSNKQKRKIASLSKQKSSLKGIIGVTQDLPLESLPWEFVFNITLDNYSPKKINEDDLAYIMFTSGSTGTPKGIMHTHKSGLNYAMLSSQLYQVKSSDKVGNHAPINFDISTFGYFSAPLAGASTVIITDAHTKFPVSLAKLIHEEQLTIWYSVPLALIQILLSGALDKIEINSLRWVLFGGEVFGLKYLKELMAKWPDAMFSNVYGPAEVNQCTYYNFNSLFKHTSQLPIGKVWDKTSYKILDSDDNEVAKGDMGVLVINSITMMKGYWGKEELTKQSCYFEKSNADQESRYYRTGDVVFENANGDLVFVGRNDRQVKLRGFRIELDEIESVLLKHPSVREASVIIVELTENKKSIYAAILLLSEAQVLPKELISFCKTNLPGYAVPERIEIFVELPRTSSGKIDRNVLKKNIINKIG